MIKKLFFIHSPRLKAGFSIPHKKPHALAWAGFIFFIILLLTGQGLAQEAQVSKAGPQNKISLDMKGMDIIDVLKILANRSGMNLVIGRNVAGKVTLFLKDVDLWDAFEIALLANDLAYEKAGGIINVMTQKDYELLYGERYKDKKKGKIIKLKYAKAADLSRALSQVKTNIGRVVVDEGSNTIVLIDTAEKIKEMEDFIMKVDLPLETRVFNLNYAVADKLSVKLQDTITKGVGSIKIDERTNKIAITDYPDKLEEMGKVISAFDERNQQVLIDAQIIELRPNDQFQMGINWDYWIKKYFEFQASLPLNVSNALIIGTHDASSTSVSQQGKYKAAIDILRTIGETNLLSSPRIIAINNEEAKIHIGTKDAYITSTTSQGGSGNTVTSQSVNFVDWGIQLRVTPTISREGFITMKLKPEVSDSTRTKITSEGQITEVPIITTSEVETAVIVKDGVTIIIGGLVKEKRSKTVKKIPILADIPGIGFLFRNTDDKVEKDELVILLTPHIITGENSYSDFSEILPKDGARAKMLDGKVITEKIKAAPGGEKEKRLGAGYYKLVIDKIKNLVLSSAVFGQQGSVKISFRIDSQGNLIQGPRVILSSNENLNQTALALVKNAAPFPAFPEGTIEKEESFSVNMEYK